MHTTLLSAVQIDFYLNFLLSIHIKYYFTCLLFYLLETYILKHENE